MASASNVGYLNTKIAGRFIGEHCAAQTKDLGYYVIKKDKEKQFLPDFLFLLKKKLGGGAKQY